MPDYSYTTMHNGDTAVAGVFQITPEMGNFPSHWAVYFTVTEIEETVQLAQQLGGSIAMPIKEIPEVGRIAMLISPQGVMFYVITPIE
jgi:predicted enzyme related to lactoylglutathione lyase